MTVLEDISLAKRWLKQNALDFQEVGDDVMIGIGYFATVWSLFDFRFLRAEGRREDVQAFIEQRIAPDLELQDFEPHLRYFRDRYLDGNTRNHHLELLGWNDYTSKQNIEQYLIQREPTPKEAIGALLLISYRLRCNLIHGSKWRHGLADQYENFRHATKAMMLIMDRY